MDPKPIYLDCNATTPLEPRVREILYKYLVHDFGNEGSRTHIYGTEAKQAVQKARDQIAAVVRCSRDEVVFTSGATESNNIAILGLMEYGLKTGKKHLITSAIEHKAVMEPVKALASKGLEVTWVPCDRQGRVEAESVLTALRPDTLLVSIMSANNETGVVQPIGEIADVLEDHPAYFHTDAAQLFGKNLEILRRQRIDLISVSGHKLYAPKGVGALVMRKRSYDRVPLQPLQFGGGQERGLRPGTIPVALVVALGAAAEIAQREMDTRRKRCADIKRNAIASFSGLEYRINGHPNHTLDHVLNLSFSGIDSEALMVGLKDMIAISNGSACTSSKYSPSHVLLGMGLSEEEANEAVRISWCHMTPDVDWASIAKRIERLR